LEKKEADEVREEFSKSRLSSMHRSKITWTWSKSGQRRFESDKKITSAEDLVDV
jgi:hypothetical protein